MRTKRCKPTGMRRVEAARCWIDERRTRDGAAPEGLEMAAFMSIFHPEVKGKKLKAILKK